MPAKTISILLLDGSPLGVRIADVGNTLAQAIAIPRKQWNDMKNREELSDMQNPGVYFLFSNASDDGRFKVYVGQSTNVRFRIDGHMNDNSKDFWNHLVCFVSRGGGLNSAHAEYLERRCYELTKAMGRSDLQNIVHPMINTLGAADKVRADDFLADMRLLLATLGFPILEERVTEQMVYSCSNQYAKGKGYYTNEGFIVIKGSLARKQFAAHVDREIPIRNEMIAEGILEDAGEHYRFTRDYLFSSPSQAAVMVLGAAANGWTAWKNKDGNTLDMNIRQSESSHFLKPSKNSL